jgi:hypothetical protein
MDSAVTEPSPMAKTADEEGEAGGRRRERLRDESSPLSGEGDGGLDNA